MNTYRSTNELTVGWYGEGEWEADFTVAEEHDALAAGVQIVPRPYLVLADNYTVPQGEVFEAAMLIEPETALISGGVIARQDPKPKTVKKTAAAPAPEDKD